MLPALTWKADDKLPQLKKAIALSGELESQNVNSMLWLLLAAFAKKEKSFIENQAIYSGMKRNRESAEIEEDPTYSHY